MTETVNSPSYSEVELLYDDCQADAAASSKSAKDWPSGLCIPGGLGTENNSGSTVFNNQPQLSTLLRTSRNAQIAAGMCVASSVIAA